MDISNWPGFKELILNPLNLLQLINQYVHVQLIKNNSLYGFIHSIDPIGHSIILLEPKEGKVQTILIPGHAIIDLCVTEPKENIIIPVKQPSNPVSYTESVAKRKTQLLFWLKENLIPVSEVCDNIVIGNVTILPPYNLTDVSTDNPIVAMQILNIMKNMPENYYPTHCE